jgi:hypothetical protein
MASKRTGLPDAWRRQREEVSAAPPGRPATSATNVTRMPLDSRTT